MFGTDIVEIIEGEVGKVKPPDELKGRLLPPTSLLTNYAPDNLLREVRKDLGDKCPIRGTTLSKTNPELRMILYNENNQELRTTCKKCGTTIS